MCSYKRIISAPTPPDGSRYTPHHNRDQAIYTHYYPPLA